MAIPQGLNASPRAQHLGSDCVGGTLTLVGVPAQEDGVGSGLGQAQHRPQAHARASSR